MKICTLVEMRKKFSIEFSFADSLQGTYQDSCPYGLVYFFIYYLILYVCMCVSAYLFVIRKAPSLLIQVTPHSHKRSMTAWDG